MSLFHTQVTLDGYDFPESHLTVLLNPAILPTNAGYNGAWNPGVIGPSAVIGSPLTWDGTNANQMRQSGNGDEIHAKLCTLENRLVEGHVCGTAALRFSDLFTIDPAATGSAIPVVGGKVKGGTTAGTVQACAGTETFFATAPRVVEVRGTQVVCLKI